METNIKVSYTHIRYKDTKKINSDRELKKYRHLNAGGGGLGILILAAVLNPTHPPSGGAACVAPPGGRLPHSGQ